MPKMKEDGRVRTAKEIGGLQRVGTRSFAAVMMKSLLRGKELGHFYSFSRPGLLDRLSGEHRGNAGVCVS